MKLLRRAIVDGSFYPASAAELKKQIEKCFANGPGKLIQDKKIKKRQEIKAVIAPHAGYIYSGMCEAYSYRDLAESNKPNLYIILGTNHTGIGNSDFLLSFCDFETPLGILRTEKWFVKKIKDMSAGISVEQNEEVHEKEHSIEVQLPFLQYINPGAKIIPIIVSTHDADKINKFARIISNLAKVEGKKVMIIASSDFTHYGPMYNFTPFRENVKENLYRLDKRLIDLIIALDTKKFLQEAGKTTICGAGAIALCMEICKQLNSKNAKLLKYYTSGDITGDYSNAVGYASMEFI